MTLAAPMTELEAVNSMLIAIGQLPVNAITPQLQDQNLALDELHKIVREVCQHGFKFNTDDDYVLIPDIDGSVRRQRLWHRSGVADNGGIGSRRSDVRNADETQSLQPKIGCQAHQEARRGGGERYSPCHTPAFLGRG